MSNSRARASKYWLCGKCLARPSKGMTGICRGNALMPGCGIKVGSAKYGWCRTCAKKYNICNGCGITKQ